MQFVSDLLLVAGAFGAALYCLVLSRRLKRFNQLENGMGGAIAVLSAQVDDLNLALQRAQSTAAASAAKLDSLTARAEQGAERLELLVATLHDLPEPESGIARRPKVVRRRMRQDELEAAE